MIALLAALAATPTASAEPLTAAQVHRLDNGLTVILEEDHRTDEVALHIRYHVGSRDEGDGLHGCAHLFEHLMFEGSRNVGNNKFDEWLTAAGGANNAFTSEDQTAYHMTFPSGALDLALFLESDRLGFLDAGLDEANLTNQKGVVLQERNEGFAAPHGRDWDALVALQFPPGHPYHVSTIGTVADVEGFSLHAVQDFWRTWYRPQNAVLVLVGNFKSDEALAKVRHWFSDMPDLGAPPPRLTAAAPIAKPLNPSRGLLTDDVEDRTVYVSWQAPPVGHADLPALEILSWVLNGGQGTRLDDALYYDKSLTTDVGVYAGPSEIDGMFIAYATSERTSLKKLDAAIGKVIAGLTKSPPTDAELKRAKVAARSGLLDQLEHPESHAELLADCQYRKSQANCLDQELAALEAVTAADVVRVASTWLKPADRVALSVVPKGDEKSALSGSTLVELP